MKKIGRKLSYITKVFLAIGLLFNNLSSLSIVFADEIGTGDGSSVVQTTPDSGTQTVVPDSGSGDNGEGKTPEGGDNGENTAGNPSDSTVNPNADSPQTPTEDSVDPTEETKPVEESVELKFEVSINENTIVVKHNKALDLDAESELIVTEDFKYLDGTYYGAEEHKVTLTEDVKNALVSDEGYSIESIILPENVYAGEYYVNAYVGEDQTMINKVIEAEGEGIEFKLYTSDEIEVNPEEDGVYVFDKDATGFIVTARLLNGGISPSDKVTIAEEEINASELFEEGQIIEEFFEGYLHGEFEYNVSLDYSLGGNPKTAEATYDISYGYYIDNTDALNESAKNVGLDGKYIFIGGYADNNVYALDNENIEEVLKDFVGESSIITYDINTDDRFIITLTDGRVTITYEETILSSDATIDARLETDNTEVNNGDTFTVKYIVNINENPINGFSGLVKYDKDFLKLTNIESSIIDGSNEDDKFLYVQWPMLQADYEEDEEGNITYKPTEYTLVTLTFEALKAGETNISIDDARFYQRDVYLLSTDEISTDIVINVGTDNTLSSLKVAGQDIQLVDDQLEYSITVANDVTKADVEAILNNNSASITSMVYPEELAEGENTVTIVVTAENGDEKVYTIKVTREASTNETAATPMSYNDTSSNTSYNEIVPDTKPADNSIDDDDDEGKEKNDDAKEEKNEKNNNLSRIIIIILILLVIAALIYLIFKDDSDEEEKQANKDINKFKKEDISFESHSRKTESKPSNNKNSNGNSRSRNTTNNKNNKKGR